MKAVWEGVTSPPPQSEALTLPVWDLIDPIDEEERLISAKTLAALIRLQLSLFRQTGWFGGFKFVLTDSTLVEL